MIAIKVLLLVIWYDNIHSVHNASDEFLPLVAKDEKRALMADAYKYGGHRWQTETEKAQNKMPLVRY